MEQTKMFSSLTEIRGVGKKAAEKLIALLEKEALRGMLKGFCNAFGYNLEEVMKASSRR